MPQIRDVFEAPSAARRQVRRAIIDADQQHPYLDYCSDLASLMAKTVALRAEGMSDPVVVRTVNEVETWLRGCRR